MTFSLPNHMRSAWKLTHCHLPLKLYRGYCARTLHASIRSRYSHCTASDIVCILCAPSNALSMKHPFTAHHTYEILRTITNVKRRARTWSHIRTHTHTHTWTTASECNTSEKARSQRRSRIRNNVDHWHKRFTHSALLPGRDKRITARRTRTNSNATSDDNNK